MERISPEEQKLMANYVSRVSDLRGKYLLNFSLIESRLDDLISIHFFPTDMQARHIFISLILHDSNMAVKVKTQIFLKMLKLFHDEINTEYSCLCEQFEGVRNFRNVIVHSSLHIEPKLIRKHPDMIYFEYYKDGKKDKKNFTTSQFQNMLGKSHDLINDLLNIENKLIQKCKTIKS